MRKLLSMFVVIASLTAVSSGVVASSAQAATFCVHPTSWYLQDPSRIGGPDLTPDLAAAILAKTGKPSLAAVMSAPWSSIDLITAKVLIATSSNGSGTGSGFSGRVGDAFYPLAQYFEFGDPGMTWQKEGGFALTLELFNLGFFGVPRCR